MKGHRMRFSATSKTHSKLTRPSDEVIQRERQQQDEVVMALRKMLARTAANQEELTLYSAA